MAGYTDSSAEICHGHRAGSKRQFRQMALVFVILGIAMLAFAIYTHFKGT